MFACTAPSTSWQVHKQKHPSCDRNALRFVAVPKHIKVKVKVKVKVTFSLRHVMKAQRGNRIIGLLFMISALDSCGRSVLHSGHLTATKNTVTHCTKRRLKVKINKKNIKIKELKFESPFSSDCLNPALPDDSSLPYVMVWPLYIKMSNDYFWPLHPRRFHPEIVSKPKAQWLGANSQNNRDLQCTAAEL